MTISRLVRGMHNTAGTITYTDFHDGLAQIGEFLEELQK